MLRVSSLAKAPVHRLRYLNAGKRGGAEPARLDVQQAQLTGLPDSGIEALLVASDLQGRSPSFGGESRLLGEALAEELEQFAVADLVPALDRIGVILCGDLYSVPEANKRGGHGDVSDVWYAFADRFRWVAGVAGNHDGFGSDKARRRLGDVANVHLLDGDCVDVDGLRLGGVGYISGDPAKRGRRDEDDQLAAVEMVLEQCLDILILHEGPRGGDGQRGNARIRHLVERAPAHLVACGHVHWPEPLATVGSSQCLNADSRAILLRRKGAASAASARQ